VAKTLTFFLQTELKSLELIISSFQEEFDISLKDLFSESEMEIYGPKVDAIAAVYVQPILSELSFDDFYFYEDLESRQRSFFHSCRSSLSIENLPFLETNPFQVTYLIELLAKFNEVLIDRGGFHELLFKESYVKELQSFKKMDSLVIAEKDKRPYQQVVLSPIDFLLKDVYQEIERLRLRSSLPQGEILSEKARRIYLIVMKEKLDSTDLYKKSGLNAKDFGDCLERLKFWLKSFS